MLSRGLWWEFKKMVIWHLTDHPKTIQNKSHWWCKRSVSYRRKTDPTRWYWIHCKLRRCRKRRRIYSTSNLSASKESSSSQTFMVKFIYIRRDQKSFSEFIRFFRKRQFIRRSKSKSSGWLACWFESYQIIYIKTRRCYQSWKSSDSYIKADRRSG